MSVINLRPVPHVRLSDYGYPSTGTVLVEVLQGDGYEIHKICHNAAPSTDFDNAPNGSEYWDGTNFKLYRKSGTLGKADGTWKEETLS